MTAVPWSGAHSVGVFPHPWLGATPPSPMATAASGRPPSVDASAPGPPPSMTPPAEDEPDPLTIVELLLAADPLAELELPPLDWPALVLVLELELVPFVAPSPAEPVPLPQALTASPTHAMQSAS